MYLRNTMPKKKKPANAVKVRARVVKERTTKRTVAPKLGSRAKEANMPKSPSKLFDAKKFTGTIPGIVEWYIENLREEARLNEEKADQMTADLHRSTRKKSGEKKSRLGPGVIDMDRFSGALPHLKGDAVKIQRVLRDER